MAMHVLSWSIGGSEGIFSRISRPLGDAIRTMQYARMMQVMSQMSDTELKSLGLTRADIPRHAQACIFGGETRGAGFECRPHQTTQL